MLNRIDIGRVATYSYISFIAQNLYYIPIFIGVSIRKIIRQSSVERALNSVTWSLSRVKLHFLFVYKIKLFTYITNEISIFPLHWFSRLQTSTIIVTLYTPYSRIEERRHDSDALANFRPDRVTLLYVTLH